MFSSLLIHNKIHNRAIVQTGAVFFKDLMEGSHTHIVAQTLADRIHVVTADSICFVMAKYLSNGVAGIFLTFFRPNHELRE